MSRISPHFKNIKNEILAELEKAKYSIFVASAYFTDSDFADVLSKKKKENLIVDLLVSTSEINDASELIFKKLIDQSVNLYQHGTRNSYSGGEMHNKFCVIDYKTVITGSFNWTNRASNNYENIVIIRDKIQAGKYLKNFYDLRRKAKLYTFEKSEFYSFFKDQIQINLSSNSNLVKKNEIFEIEWSVLNVDYIKIFLNELKNPIIESDEKKGFGKISISKDSSIFLKTYKFKENENTFDDYLFETSFIETLYIKVIQEPKIQFNVNKLNIVRSEEISLNWNITFAEKVILKVISFDSEYEKEVNLNDNKCSSNTNY
jgi:hypothetical protein